MGIDGVRAPHRTQHASSPSTIATGACCAHEERDSIFATPMSHTDGGGDGRNDPGDWVACPSAGRTGGDCIAPSLASLLVSREPVARRVQGELEPITHLQLAVDGREMIADRLLADEQS